MRCTLIVIAAFAALGLASPAAAQSKKKNCPDPVADSTTGLMVYQKCHVDREAKPKGNPPRMDWNPNQSDMRDGACFSAEYRFIVDTTGLPIVSSIKRVRASNSDFGDAVQQQVEGMRYEPAMLEGRPVPFETVYRTSAAIRRVVSSSPGGARPPSGRVPGC